MVQCVKAVRHRSKIEAKEENNAKKQRKKIREINFLFLSQQHFTKFHYELITSHPTKEETEILYTNTWR